MKKLLIAVAVAGVVASGANASGLVPNVPQEAVIVDTASSNHGILVPAFAIIMLLLVNTS